MNFTYNNKNYPIIINYKNNKNLYIKVDDDFNIRINSPYLYPKLLIKKIVKENYKSIAKMIDEKEYDKDLIKEAIVYEDISKQPARIK